MRPIDWLLSPQVKRSLTFGGGIGFERPPFWTQPDELLFSGTPMVGERETVEGNFDRVVEQAYKASGVVFACILARMLPFSEPQLLFQEMVEGRPGRLHASGGDLSLLQAPWPNATTGELLARMEQDASLAGNFYGTDVGRGARRIRRLRPDWVTIITGIAGDPAGDSPFDLDAEVLGYVYQPQVAGRRYEPVFLTPARVAHWSPIPDPIAQWRGMSWLTPVVREIQADKAATEHKLMFFKNGATPQIVIRYDKDVPPEKVKAAMKLFAEQHRGVHNAYKAFHVGSGADATVVGADMRQIDFKATQGAGETRIAAAAGVGAIIARFSEGLAGSALNQGNYQAAKHQFADMVLRPNWRTAVTALTRFADVPAGSRLWYDDAIPFLAEDAKDAADILRAKVDVITSLTTNGFDADAAVNAALAMDLERLLGNHNGLPSVQQQRTTADT